eukprot:m.150149 g.150149  ORF g.150149 m.150149 type:complete len:298 (-) comp16167_c8_seq8:219-1112(-)
MLNVLSAIIVLVALTMPFFAFIPLMNDVWSFSSQYHRRDVYAKTIPYTTRQPREGEIDGKHYRFVSQAAFDEMVAKDEFIEYGENNGVFYGTPRNPELEQTDLKRSTSVLHLRKLADFKAATIVLEKERPDELFGMELLKGPEHIYVYSVTPGSPAHRAFVRPNMQLLAINGEDMTHAKLSDAQQRLATAGPRVELFLRYDKDGQDKAVAVAKETASTPLSKRLEEEETARQEQEKQRQQKEEERQKELEAKQQAEQAALAAPGGPAARQLWGLVLAIVVAILGIVFAIFVDLPFLS